MLNKCTDKIWVIVELCESIRPQKVSQDFLERDEPLVWVRPGTQDHNHDRGIQYQDQEETLGK